MGLIPMKQPQREAIIIFLDQMGKFSFIDLFVSLYMIVSFYVSITEQLKGFGLNIKVVVEPDVGLNTFVIGTAISMIFSHFFLFLDAKYAKPHIKKLRNKQQRQKDINNALNVQYQIDQVEENENIKNKHKYNLWPSPLCIRFVPESMFGVFVRSVMLLLIFATLWTVIDSVFTAPVRYNISGLVGFFVTNSVRSYSPWQIVTEVPSHTDEHTAAYPLSFTFFITIIFFPLLLTVSMIIIW